MTLPESGTVNNDSGNYEPKLCPNPFREAVIGCRATWPSPTRRLGGHAAPSREQGVVYSNSDGDQPGVLAGIARCFGDNGVSIASVIQKETDEAAQTAELVIMTHAAREAAVQATISQLQGLEEVRQVGNFLRVED